ncbi:chorismate-binding protein [Polaribacter marinaquae]|uniref:isochorismate synthase n=1 Tax=Polaribacter marinaquae TaxID=1642819 RepID=A0ABZ2TT78_9FLAO
MNNLLDTIAKHFSNNLPFVAYRKPNKSLVTAFLLKDNSLEFTSEFTESGFVFAPYKKEEKAILFSDKKALIISENIDTQEKSLRDDIATSLVDSVRDKHINIVDKAVETIKTSNLQKVVISREELVKLNPVNILEIYKTLLSTYKNAFVYVWFHPEIGLWFGATPETLLNLKGTNFKTMSLAGTQVNINKKDIIWKSKELEEQQLVTNFIETQLQPISNNLIIDKTETINAGSLLHLRTKVSGILSEKSNLKELIRALHPTPAVCGLPRNLASNFIDSNEGYSRTFYTGFLGELNFNVSKTAIRETALFVNLRCMKIKENTAYIYVGGGITKDSIAEKEWEETVSKSKTMKRVLN